MPEKAPTATGSRRDQLKTPSVGGPLSGSTRKGKGRGQRKQAHACCPKSTRDGVEQNGLSNSTKVQAKVASEARHHEEYNLGRGTLRSLNHAPVPKTPVCQLEQRRVNVLVWVTRSWETAIANPLPPHVVQAHARPHPGSHNNTRVLRTSLCKWTQVVEYVGQTIKFYSWWTLPYSLGENTWCPHPRRGHGIPSEDEPPKFLQGVAPQGPH